MAYITSDELTARAEKKEVDLSAYTEDELEELIEACQLFVEEQTGRIFEQREITERFNRFYGTRLQLKYYPVLSVESLTIDTQGVSWYLHNPDLGIILFDISIYNAGPYNLNNIIVTYTTCPFPDNPDKVHPTARKLVADMCLSELLKSPDGREVSSIKEGDITESYTNVDWVEKRIEQLRRPILTII